MLRSGIGLNDLLDLHSRVTSTALPKLPGGNDVAVVATGLGAILVVPPVPPVPPARSSAIVAFTKEPRELARQVCPQPSPKPVGMSRIPVAARQIGSAWHMTHGNQELALCRSNAGIKPRREAASA